MRIAPAIGTALALVAVAAPTTPAHSSEARPASASQEPARPALHASQRAASRDGDIGLDTSTLGASFVHVSWHWIKAASGYRIQVAKTSDFSSVVTTRKKQNSKQRPAGGREATVVGKLHDATYYWVRVRKVRGSNRGPWSDAVRVATEAAMPAKITGANGRRGPEPGSTTIHWKSDGDHTDYYRILTALTPFGSAGHPGDGRHPMSWRVPGSARSFTMTPEQTAEAGAPLGSARHLFFRVKAVREGRADTAVREYAHLGSTPIRGQDATGTGTELRFAQYNMRVAAHDAPGHPWKDRQHLIAKNIADIHPAVASLQELMAGMWTDDQGGVGLDAALKQAGAGRYQITRTTPYWKGAPQDTRILYDPNKVTLVSDCPTDTPSCYILLPDPKKKQIAAYAKFRDNASGEEFYFVSAHLTAGNDADTDALRGSQVQAMSDGIKDVNRENLPVIFGSDCNSSQVSKGSDSPHNALVDNGWYNTQAAAEVVNEGVNSVNAYHTQSPSPYGFGSMYDTIATLNLPGASLWKQVLTGSPWPSDHNMVFTDLRLP
jgi:endonuclease/exonuclease/phosphatase family metal-dependent hydrolase